MSPTNNTGEAKKRSSLVTPLLMNLFPFFRWFKYYSNSKFRADFIAGLTVALVLIPQSMAYAQLAGLPAFYGLYAALLPPLIAALFGSSYQLATGPVAVVSLMTATALAPLAPAGSQAFIAYAILLALLVGIVQFTLGSLRLGLVVNFLSHPVVNGFTNAAAIIIATSQLSSLLGVYVDSAAHHYQTIYNVLRSALVYVHLPSLAFAALAFVIMITLRRVNRRIPNVLVAVVVTTVLSWAIGFERNATTSIEQIKDLQIQTTIAQYNRTLQYIDSLAAQKVVLRKELAETATSSGSESGAALRLNLELALLDQRNEELNSEGAELRTELRALRFQAIKGIGDSLEFSLRGAEPSGARVGGIWRLKVGSRPIKADAVMFISGGAVVGKIPRGLPKFALPDLNFTVAMDLITMAVIISLLGFMEAISIAKAMAAKTGQHLDPNQELIGQGLANILGSFSSSYPVSGSFSRSAVNLQAGAVTGLSSAFSSVIVLVTLLFMTPLLYYLPQSVLAAIIIMAVINLINVRGFIHTWHAQKYDGVIAIVTFIFTLAFAPHLDKGIMIGVVLSLGHFMLRNMKPDIATLSKWKDGTFRNAQRRQLKTCEHIAVIRFNNSLFFANVNYLEEKILEPISQMPQLRHIHVVGNSINEIDASGAEVLAQLVDRVHEAGYGFSMSGLNDSVLATMSRTHLYEKIGENRIFGNVALAVQSVMRKTHENSQEIRCPLVESVPLDDADAESKP